LAPRLDGLARRQPVLRIDDRDVALPPSAFGQPAALAERLSAAAAQTGRETPLSGLTVALRAAARGGTTISAPVVDAAALRAAVAALAAEVDRPAVEPQITIDRDAPQAALQVQPSRVGRRLDVDRTVAGLLAASAGTTGA